VKKTPNTALPVVGAQANALPFLFFFRSGWARSWNPDATTYTEDEFYRATYLALHGQGSHGTFVHLYLYVSEATPNIV
jgi:hypothetical protein